jgi:hypothetical protein
VSVRILHSRRDITNSGGDLRYRRPARSVHCLCTRAGDLEDLALGMCLLQLQKANVPKCYMALQTLARGRVTRVESL